MPICEVDPWRLQYFDHVETAANIPTEDSDAWRWYPAHRWVYDKLAVALSQNLDAGPHGIQPPRFPVFSKPIVNLKGMGVGSRVLRTAADYEQHYAPGHFWMTLLESRQARARSITGPCMPSRTPISRSVALPGCKRISPAIPACSISKPSVAPS